jgi:ribonuclease VapC
MGRFREILENTKSGRTSLAISRINYGEIIYGVHKEPGWSIARKDRTLEVVSRLPLEIVSVPDSLVDAAVRLKSKYAISYADGFGASLAMERGLSLVTGDKDFRRLEVDGLLQLYWVGA